MIYTLADLRREVLRRADELDDSPSTSALVDDFLAIADEQRATATDWPFMVWPRDEEIVTAPGERVYALHPACDRPTYIWNVATRRLLQEVPTRSLPSSALHWQDSSGPAAQFMLWGSGGVAGQPDAPTRVTIASSSAADTGSAYTVTVRGMDGAGAEHEETLVLAGTTPVVSVGAFAHLFAPLKSRVFNGSIMLTPFGGGAPFLTLGPTEMGRQHRLVRLVETPVASETLRYRFQRKPRRMVHDGDLPNLPSPYCQVLVFDALIDLGTYNTDIDAAEISIWSRQQQRWDAALEAAYRDSQTLGSGTRTVLDAEAADASAFYA